MTDVNSPGEPVTTETTTYPDGSQTTRVAATRRGNGALWVVALIVIVAIAAIAFMVFSANHNPDQNAADASQAAGYQQGAAAQAQIDSLNASQQATAAQTALAQTQAAQTAATQQSAQAAIDASNRAAEAARRQADAAAARQAAQPPATPDDSSTPQ